ncbi:MAG: ATP-binding protein [Actinomycetota bacterium]
MAQEERLVSFEHVLPAGPVAVGEARRHVRSRLAGILPTQAVADVELLTSELVSNAVRHALLNGNGTIGLSIESESATVRISVVDSGEGFDPTKRARDPGPDEGGWGLFLVEEMSDRWGIDESPHGVWFEIDHDGGASASSTNGYEL